MIGHLSGLIENSPGWLKAPVMSLGAWATWYAIIRFLEWRAFDNAPISLRIDGDRLRWHNRETDPVLDARTKVGE